MRTYVNQSEIADLWVKRVQPHARASAMSFEGDKFFSYSTVIAQRVKLKSGRLVYLVNDSRYSKSSSVHQNLVRSAIPKTAKVVLVPGCSRWPWGDVFFDHKRIITEFRGGIQWRQKEAATSREPKKSRLLKEAQEIGKRMNAYAKLFGAKL